MTRSEGGRARRTPWAARAASAWAVAWVAAGAPAPAGAAPRAAEPPLTNRALLVRSFEGAARQLVAAAPLDAGARVAVRAGSDRAVDQEALAAVLAALVERGIEAWPVGGPEAASAAGGAEAAAGESVALPADSAFRTPGTPPSLAEIAALQQQRNPKHETRGAGGGPRPAAPAAAAALDLAALPLLELQVDEARVDYTRLYRSGVLGAQHVERRAVSHLSARLLKPEVRSVAWVGAADTASADVVPRSELRSLEDASRPELKGTVPVQAWTKAAEPLLVGALVVGLVALFYTNRP